MNEMIDFVLHKCPIGLIILDKKMDIVFKNKKADIFLKRFELPDDVINIIRRIFNAIDDKRLDELFPGEIYVFKKFEGSPSNWRFRFYIYEKDDPLIYILIIEETISNKLDMNDIRKQYRLTRRETDVLRRVLDGLKNIEIAEELEITEQTVKDHLSNIYIKMNSENRLTLLRKLLGTPNMNS
ncbi:MAG: helix-turn-helix transcriptional regulator [Nitrospirae bacterium]|nr:helix-turn-helix transcriptional regulator [Nitrospirota bacterium]